MIKFFPIFGLCLLLMACQSTSTKPNGALNIKTPITSDNSAADASEENLSETEQETKQEAEPETELAKAVWYELQQETVANLREKSFGEAADNLSQAVAIAGDDNKRWEYILMGLVSLPPDLALPLAEQALKLKQVKKSDQELFGFSKVYTQFKKLEPALTAVNKAIKIKRKEEYVFWRARLHLMLKSYKKAEKDYLWLLKKDDSKEAYISQYATLLTHLDRANEAKALLEKHKNNPQLLYKSILLSLGRDDKANALLQFEQLQKELTPDAMDDQHKLEIGELAFMLGDAEYGLSILSGVKSGDKSNQAKLIMGRILMSQENHDRAIIMFRQAQNGIEEHAILAYLFEADAHNKLEEKRIAIRTLTQAISIYPNNSDLLYSRAMIYESQKKLSAMEKDLQTIIDSDETHHDALNALGYSWAERNVKLAEALELIQRAHDLEPENAAILDSLGWVYYRLGDLEQARHYLELATNGSYVDNLMLEHLLEVLKEVGDKDAIKTVEQLLQSNSELEFEAETNPE